MRLIDADKLLVHLNDCALSASPGGGSLKKQMIARVEYDTIQNCMKAVESQPTAYDVDGVVDYFTFANFRLGFRVACCRNNDFLLCRIYDFQWDFYHCFLCES